MPTIIPKKIKHETLTQIMGPPLLIGKNNAVGIWSHNFIKLGF